MQGRVESPFAELQEPFTLLAEPFDDRVPVPLARRNCREKKNIQMSLEPLPFQTSKNYAS